MQYNVYEFEQKSDIPDEDRVEVPCEYYNEYLNIIDLSCSLMGGTLCMRKQGRKYLPQEEGETDKSYQNRLERTFLVNIYGRTIQKLVGEVFRLDIIATETVPEYMEEWFENINLCGKNITQFFSDVFRTALIKGLCYVLVDFPDTGIEINDKGVPVFYDDDEWKLVNNNVIKEKGWRPYLVLIDPIDVIGGRYSIKNGRQYIEQIRIRETTLENKGKYGNEIVTKIRVLYPGKYELWRAVEKDKKTSYVLESSGETSFKNYIPIHKFIIGQEFGEFYAHPPLSGLCDLNLAHYQSLSDQRNILHFARLITWFGKMLVNEDNPEDLIFGPNRLIHSTDPSADLKIVEHSGKAIDSGRQDLKDLEDKMAIFGLSMLIPKVDRETATSKSIDTSENDSVLERWALSLQDFIEDLLLTLDRVGGIEPTETYNVKVNSRFRPAIANSGAVILLNSYMAGLVTKEVVLEEFKKRGIISDDLDITSIVEALETELPQIIQQPSKTITA